MNRRVWSTEKKATLADLLGKVRAGLLPHFTRDTDANVSAGYETSDLPRLINRLAAMPRRRARHREDRPHQALAFPEPAQLCKKGRKEYLVSGLIYSSLTGFTSVSKILGKEERK